MTSGTATRFASTSSISADGSALEFETHRRAAIAAKLDTCSVALQNIKFDLMRLGAGAQTHQQITSLAMDALSLADSVDRALFVADEMGRLTDSRSAGGRSAARPG